jgi:hypothetical protein
MLVAIECLERQEDNVRKNGDGSLTVTEQKSYLHCIFIAVLINKSNGVGVFTIGVCPVKRKLQSKFRYQHRFIEILY